MTSSKTPPACSTPFTSSSSLATLSMRCVAASSKTRPVTVDARAIPSIKSGFFCAPHVIGSPRANKNASVRPSWQMRRISVSKSPTFTGQVRDVFHQDTPAQGQRLAAHLIERLPACPIPEIARLGRTLRKWKDAFLAYFDTDGASNGPTEAINGIIELGRRTARGYRNPTNYKLRMLLIAGGLDASTHTQLGRAGKPPTFPSTPQKSDRSDAATQIETTAMSLRGRTISAPAVTRGNLGVELIC